MELNPQGQKYQKLERSLGRNNDFFWRLKDCYVLKGLDLFTIISLYSCMCWCPTINPHTHIFGTGYCVWWQQNYGSYFVQYIFWGFSPVFKNICFIKKYKTKRFKTSLKAVFLWWFAVVLFKHAYIWTIGYMSPFFLEVQLFFN